ncbi:Chaperonin CPN60-like 2 [Citrus sinensis]|nr:Chaperonin CPN60-like 2 [Citrus sinensis]
MFTVESFVAFTVGNGGCARFIKEVANPACHACDFGVCLDEEKGDNELEFVNGMKLDRGYASPSSLTKRTKHVVCVVKPSTHELNNKRDILQDLTVLTGGQVVTGGFDVKLMPRVLGSCKEKTLKRDVKRFVVAFSNVLPTIHHSPLYSLVTGVALVIAFTAEITVGIHKRVTTLSSGVNLHKMNITLDNARIAVKAALEEGIVPGGGVALLHASKAGSAVFELRRKLLGHAVVFTDISLDKAIEFNGLCHHQGRNFGGDNKALLLRRLGQPSFNYLRHCRNVAEKLLTSGRNPVEHNFDSTHNDDIVAEEIDQMDESVVSSISVNDALVPFHKRIYNGFAANLTSRATKDCGADNLENKIEYYVFAGSSN